MPLPNLANITPQFDLTIPSTNKESRFRPFVVKEEKILLIALESNDEKLMLDAIAQVVASCAMSPLKVDDLANFDLEYIFLKLRGQSVNNIIELSYKCHNEVKLSPEEVEHRFRGRNKPEGTEDFFGSCDNVVTLQINLDEVKVQFNPDHIKQIYLSDTLGINMRYPNFKMAKQMVGKKEGKDKITDALQSLGMCIESVFDSESVYTNFSTKEMQDWIEQLTQPQFVKLQTFFETMPKLAHDLPFHCPKCGYNELIHIEGLPNFFE